MAERNTETPQPLPSAEAAPAFNPDESPLAWLVRRKDKDGRPLIAREEFDAGERLRADFHFALMGPRVTAAWSALPVDRAQRRGAPGFGIEMQDHVVAARARVQMALHAVGPELAGLLIDVCCYLKGIETLEKDAGYPQRSGKILLRVALQILARHYGLAAGASAAPVRARMRHWGTADFRPALDPEPIAAEIPRSPSQCDPG